MQQLRSFTEYEMVIAVLDMEKSTDIAISLGKYWVNFLSEYYKIIENRIVIYKQYGCRKYKFIGDAAFIIFHPQFAREIIGEIIDDPQLRLTGNYAFGFVSAVNSDIQEWIKMSRKHNVFWINLLDQVLDGKPMRIIASLVVGSVIPFEEPDKPDRVGERCELAGIAIHCAQRLMKVHELLPQNNIFVTEKCYKQLLKQNQRRLYNITDLQLKGFSHTERVRSGTLSLPERSDCRYLIP